MTQPTEDKAIIHLEPAPKAMASVLILAATIMVVLDQTIANVALPHMQAALGATSDTISWVLTSYILATAIATPITGWLAGRMGRNRLFGISIIGFTVSSALCGLSVSLPMMVCARVSQGLFGAFLMPLSQAFVYDMNKPSEQVRALTIWGIGVMVAPVVGPALGGFLTETYNWRWVFFINVPIGVIAAIGIFAVMPKFPAERRSFDRMGFALIALALCGLQLALDRGTQLDWFDSPEILIELGVSISAFWLLIFHLRSHPNAIIPIELFRNRNFMGAMVLALVVGPIAMTGAALLPPLMQVLLGYPVILSGLLVMPRGLAMAVSMLFGAKLLQRVDGRVAIGIGLMLVFCSQWLQTISNLQMDSSLFIWTGLAQGAGMGLTMQTANLLAVSTLPAQLRTDGAAVYALMRNVGGSLMISLMTALLARNIQINHAEVGSAIHANSLPGTLTNALNSVHAMGQAAAFADAEVNRQAMMIAYVDDFWLMAWFAAALIPMVFFLKPIRAGKGEKIEIVE